MRRCPLTYLPYGKARYSPEGLKALSPKLRQLHDFPYSHDEQLKLASAYATKLSLQGVQPKFCANLKVTAGEFVPVEKGGRFIMKPAHFVFKELPENEDLTMRLATLAGLDVPVHGLLYCQDDSLIYFIKRFDRDTKGRKIAIEDFAQLSEGTRATKYDSSMEKVATIVETFCSFPRVEKQKLLRLVVFSFLSGNEDLHLKNLSIIRQGKVVTVPKNLNKSIHCPDTPAEQCC